MKHDTALVKMLEAKGFTAGQEWSEAIYTRANTSDARMTVKVCTGIPAGHRRKSLRVSQVRIYTLLVTTAKTYPIGRFEPIIKQGDEQAFLDEVLKTMRAAYVRGSEWLAEKGGSRPNGNPETPQFRGGFIELPSAPETPLDKL
jgi:hypothetical protein